jgi:hypothetical protein
VVVNDLIGHAGALAQELDDLGVTLLLDRIEEAEGGVVTGEFVVVEQYPAPDFPAFLGTVSAELAGLLDEIVEDDRGLAELLVAMDEHGRFPCSLTSVR